MQSAQIAQQPDDDDTSQMDSAQDSTDVDGALTITSYKHKNKLIYFTFSCSGTGTSKN